MYLVDTNILLFSLDQTEKLSHKIIDIWKMRKSYI